MWEAVGMQHCSANFAKSHFSEELYWGLGMLQSLLHTGFKALALRSPPPPHCCISRSFPGNCWSSEDTMVPQIFVLLFIPAVQIKFVLEKHTRFWKSWLYGADYMLMDVSHQKINQLRGNPVLKTYKESQTVLLYLFPGKFQNVFLFPSDGDHSSDLHGTPRTG